MEVITFWKELPEIWEYTRFFFTCYCIGFLGATIFKYNLGEKLSYFKE